MEISPFQIRVSGDQIADLRQRLRNTRWPALTEATSWKYGAPEAWLRDLCAYWADGFDWPAVESTLNDMPQFLGRDGEFTVHFVHARSKEPDAVPLILTIGWPSTFAEVLPVLNRLTDPGSYGGDPRDAFHVVVPTLPGFGFSTPLPRDGWIPSDDLWVDLMSTLGYEQFFASGSDWGANVTNQLGRRHPERLLGLHYTSPDLELPSPVPASVAADVAAYEAQLEKWVAAEGAYHAVQRTKPQTLAFGLSDSPAGLAAWILEKFQAWAGDLSNFSKDDLLTTATLYWVTNTAASSSRIYYEFGHDENVHLAPGEQVTVPTGVLTFPRGAEPNLPRRAVELSYPITRWTDSEVGGHFPAFETPELFASELREFARPLR